MSEKPITLLQITDCHLGEVSGTKLLSMDPDESLDDVLRLAKKQYPDPDFMLVTGDLANEPSSEAYGRLLKKLQHSMSCPMAWLPGNHDVPEIMGEFGADINHKIRDLGDWLLILLNSRKPKRIYGQLSEQELSLLEQTLKANPDKHIVITMHHQPVPIYSQWMDNYIVRNADEFWKLAEHYPQVKLVLWGHVHQEFESNYNNIRLLATPSTCIQFTPGKKAFHIDNTMPGYRWLKLYPNGDIESGVERVEEKDYGIDFSSNGY